jgi:PadR family transcriptional regulator, regulatory protein AphA
MLGAMKKRIIERPLGTRVTLREPSVEEVIRAMKTDAAGPRRVRFPEKTATLDLALLGLIAETPGVSGYDLVKVFDRSMEHYWHAYPTQIYATLERMEDFGVIWRRKVTQRKRPTKQVYTINPSGERLLVEWLEGPFEGLKLKHPPLLRCRFLGHLGADGARAVLEEERFAWTRYLKRYREMEGKYFAGGRAHREVNTMFTWFTLKRGINWMEENIRWCDWALGEIERNRALFPEVSMKGRLKPTVPFDEFVQRIESAKQMTAKRKHPRGKEGEREKLRASK